MFFDTDLKGDHLPPKTICLTYDDGPGETAGDGPGPRTAELGRYLAGEGVRATFFVVGVHAAAHPDVVRELHARGHLVGNHTWSHPGLVALAAAGGDVVGELDRTDALVRRLAPADVVLFRAPYGNWREKLPGSDEDNPRSIICRILNRSGKLARTVGPVNWDVVAEDWDCWRHSVPPEEAARRYAAEAERVGRGIVLLHDSAEEEELRGRNRTLELTRLLVPALRQKGFRFVRLDEVPQVRSAVRVSYQVVLRAEDGTALVRSGGAMVFGEGAAEALGVVDLGGNRVALRAGNGLYIGVGPDGAAADQTEAEGPAVLEWEQTAPGRICLRAGGGLQRDGRQLIASPRGRAEAFQVERLFEG